MVTERLLSDELLSPKPPASASQGTDSSRLLLGLMNFAQSKGSTDSLGGVISADVLRSLLSGLQFRDMATVQHSRRVAMLAAGMAHYLGWEDDQKQVIEIAALLHDVGKIGVPDNILFKPGKLSPDESELMALHYNVGLSVLQACRVHNDVLEIVGQSHTHYGSETGGYQRSGSSIHQGARILAVADAYDSLATDQVYREGKPHDEIMKTLNQGAGTRFDGIVVSALARWIESDGIPFSRETAGMMENESTLNSTNPTDALDATSLGHIFSYLYVLESLYDGYFVVDSDMRFVVWNRGLERMLGMPASEMLDETWTNGVLAYTDANGTQMTGNQCPMNRIVADGKPATSTLQIQRSDQTLIEVELQSVPLLHSEGQLHGVAEIFRDLSQNARRPKEYRELRLAATRDALTSVANRGELETQLKKLFADYTKNRRAEPFSVIFIDIDFFKSINDTFGHSVGDQVLIDFARLLQDETYSGEIIARYGGEEFVILCPATDLEQAVARAERVRCALPRAELGNISDYNITASFGVTQVEPEDSVGSILERADKELYRAKDSGRNKTCWIGVNGIGGSNDSSDEIEDENSDPFVFLNTFNAYIAADMIVYKLGGFVNDNKGKLIEVEEKRAVVHLGKKGFLSSWGNTDERQPIVLVIENGDEEPPATGQRKAAARQASIRVEIRPLGRFPSAEVFQARAMRALKMLRSYFAAND